MVVFFYQNEISHQGMLKIMRQQHIYLEREFNGVVPSGGDLLTCERQRCAQQHVMDSDTREQRLEPLEPVIEDWHTLMCLLQVNHHANIHIYSTVCCSLSTK